MTEQDFMQNIAAAQKLCSPDGERLIESKKSNAPLSKADVDPASFDAEASGWDKMFLSDAAYEDNSPTPQARGTAKPKAPVMTQQSVSKSRVPDFIKKSMMTESIDTTALSSNPLDRMDLSRFERKEVSPRQQVVEQVSAPQQATISSGIDYPLIRAIINECIDNKFKELGITKESLNENTLKTIHLKGGNIKLVDNSGNIYSAQLEKKGNINEGRK